MIWVSLVLWIINLGLSESSRRIGNETNEKVFFSLQVLFVILAEIFVFVYLREFFGESLLGLILGFALISRNHKHAPRIFDSKPKLIMFSLMVFEVAIFLVGFYFL